MASVSVTETQFLCAICLEVLKEPVSIPCGHTYCLLCISHYWDQDQDQDQDQAEAVCPQCRESFSPRPVLRRNTVLAEVVDRLRSSESLSEPPVVELQEIQRVLQNRMRAAERDLEEFQQNVTSLKVSASVVLEDCDAIFTDMTQRLEKTRAEVRSRLEATERSVLSRAERDQKMMEEDLDELRRRDQEITHMRSTEEPDLLQVQYPPVSSRGPRGAVFPCDVFSAARRVLCELRARVEQVCREEEDRLSRTVTENNTTGRVGRNTVNCKPRQTLSASVDSRAAPVAFSLSSLSLPSADHRMRISFLRFACNLTLDRDTAHSTVVLLEGLQGAHCGEEPQPHPPHPQRFDSVAQVLCREGQASGTSYWEVEWRGRGWVDIGVTYRGIGRKGGGKQCLLGRNDQSWRLRCSHAGYVAWHDNRKTTVAAPPCGRVGVLLERHTGALSFYSVSDSLLLLHCFRACFTQPLYPAFRLDLDSTVVLCPRDGS